MRQLVGSGDKSELAKYRLHERGFFIVDGYSTDKVFSNVQFKVGLALRAAGLQNSDYARTVMMSLAKPSTISQAPW